MLARLKPLLSPQHIRNIIFLVTTTTYEVIIMNKNTADKLALIMARDVLRTPSEHYRNLNQFTAEEIAEFISTLSNKLQEIISNDVTSTDIINAHKHQ